jgi:hypothetical protein
MAVGKITSKLVPKAILMAMSGATSIARISHKLTGTITAPPPIPSSPLAKPVPAPVASNMRI